MSHSYDNVVVTAVVVVVVVAFLFVNKWSSWQPQPLFIVLKNALGLYIRLELELAHNN